MSPKPSGIAFRPDRRGSPSSSGVGPRKALDAAPNPRSLACADTVETRARALARHRSQTTDLIADAEVAFRLPPEVAAIVDRPTEIHLELP